MKNKTNISVRDNLDHRIVVSMEIGESAGYTSGDILDANATANLINKTVDGAITSLPTNVTTGYTANDTRVNWNQKRYYKCTTVEDANVPSYGDTDYNVLFDGDVQYGVTFKVNDRYDESQIVNAFNDGWSTFQDIDENYFDEGSEYSQLNPGKAFYVFVQNVMYDIYYTTQKTFNLQYSAHGINSSDYYYITHFERTEDVIGNIQLPNFIKNIIVTNDSDFTNQGYYYIGIYDSNDDRVGTLVVKKSEVETNYKFTPIERNYSINTDVFSFSNTDTKLRVGNNEVLISDIIEYINWAKTNNQGPWTVSEPAQESEPSAEPTE